MMRQFDVILVDLNPTVGSEQKGIRPCVVLETNGFRGYGSITMVCPITTKLKKVYSYETVLNPSNINGLKEKSKLLIRQIRVVDKRRVIKKIGHLEKNYHDGIRYSLKVLFDLLGDFGE